METDYRKVVDEIQAFMRSPDQTEDAQIKSLAVQYAEACRYVNDRLRRCGELIEQGLRPQAIELAEVEPDLLATTALLDFPERAEWEEIAASYGWDRAYGLKLETADLLNQAYALEEQLGPLMQKHRFLSLAQGPLDQRIAVMRQIAATDTISPFWNEDIRGFERGRFDQLAQIAVQAQQSADLDTMSSVVKEVRTVPWLQKPPNALLLHVQRLAARVSETQVLPALAEQLGNAHLSTDVEWGRELRTQWNAAVRDASQGSPGWQPDRNLARVVKPALEWLKALDQRDARNQAFEEALAQLQASVTERAPWAEVRKDRDAVLAFGRGIPEPVGAVYREYRNNVVLDFIIKLVLFVGLMIGTMVGFVYLIRYLSGR